MGKMQREKGKRGEREVVELIKRYGFEARRGQQFKGGADSPDVIHDIARVYIEVKYREKFSIYPALEQAGEESDDIPVVFHRRSGKPWVVILDARHFMGFMQQRRAYFNQNPVRDIHISDNELSEADDTTEEGWHNEGGPA